MKSLTVVRSVPKIMARGFPMEGRGFGPMRMTILDEGLLFCFEDSKVGVDGTRNVNNDWGGY